MHIHPIQTGTVAVKEHQRHGKRGRGYLRLANTLLDKTWTAPLPIFAWIIEHPEGLIVVDTGETAQVNDNGYFPRWHPYFRWGVREWVEPEDEIGPQMRTHGLDPDDVRWLIMTHLHTDHAGGLHHFPKAEILVARREYEAASGLKGRLQGFLPNRWPRWFEPRLVDFKPEAFGPFPRSFTLTQAGDIHLVPTPGHTAGHLSVIADQGETAVVFAGDVSYTEQTLLDQVVDGVTLDYAQAQESLRYMLGFVRSRPTIYLPSHDPDAARRLYEGRAAAAPPVQRREPAPAV